MAKISTNNIPNIDADWALDEKTGLPYSGLAVQKFIKDTLNEKTASVYFDSAASVLYTFKSESDLNEWFGSKNEDLVLSQTAISLSGTQYVMTGISKMDIDWGDTIYFSTEDSEAKINVGFESKKKTIISDELETVYENAYFLVRVDAGNKGVFTQVGNRQLVQRGKDFSFDLKPYLISGDNNVEIEIIGATSNASTTVTFYANLTSMYLSCDSFNWHTSFIKGNLYKLGGFNIGGNLDKTFHVIVKNEDLGYYKEYSKKIGIDLYVQRLYYFEDIEFPDTGSGVYSVEIWVDGAGKFETKHFQYNIICINDVDVKSVNFVAINNVVDKVLNFSNTKVFDYCVYNAGSVNSSISIGVSINGEVVQFDNLTIETQKQLSYSLSLEYESEQDVEDIKFFIENGNEIELTLPIDNTFAYRATDGAVFYLNPANRDNQQENKEFVINAATGEEIPTEWLNFTWKGKYSGWGTDDLGKKALIVPATAHAEIQYQPLKNVDNTGKTIEFVLKTANVSNYDSPIIKICTEESNSFTGILIKPTQIIVHSSSNKDSLRQCYNFKDEESIHLVVSIAPNYNSAGNLAMIYANGVRICEFDFSISDSWTSNSNIILGSDTSDLYLYKLRVYDKSLDQTAILNNYINQLDTPEEKNNMFERLESVVDDSGNIYFEEISTAYNTMVIEMLDYDSIPGKAEWTKDLRKSCNFEMIYPENPEWNFKIENVGIEGQGTTSMNYWRWNLRIRLDKSDDASVFYNNVKSDDSKKVWFDGENHHPKVNRITAKKNYASSSHGHKMGATRAFNDLHHYLGLYNEVEGMVSVYQYPVYGFQKIWSNESNKYVYRFIGLYTIGPDKGDKSTFGYDNKQYKEQLIHLEGKDHDLKGVDFRYPWSQLKYIGKQGDETIEALCFTNNTGENVGTWEVGASGSAETDEDIQEYLNQEFKPAYEVVYNNSTMILGTSDSIENINLDVETWRKQKDDDGHSYNRFEIWSDGVYDLYYYNEQNGKYETTGINLLSDLNISRESLSGKSIKEKNELFKEKRRLRFKENADQYWHIDDSIFHYCFLLLIGATDNFQKNTYPYKFGTLENRSRWRWRQDDLDTIFDIDNRGLSTKTYSIEAHDWESDEKIAYTFKGENSSFWRLLDECYEDEIKQMMLRIFSAMVDLGGVGSGNTLQNLFGFFEKYFWNRAQNYFTKSAYGFDGEYSYESAWEQYGKLYNPDIHPLNQAMGDHLETERSWVENRLVYMMSKFSYGPFANYDDTCLGRITFRTQEQQSFNLTPAIDLYPTMISGDNAVYQGERKKSGESATIRDIGGGNTSIYFMASDYLKDLGDWSNVAVDGADLAIVGKRLERIKIGDESANNVTAVIKKLNIGDCPSLISIDARNSTSLAGTVDLSKCPRIQEALFGGTQITELIIPEGSMIKRIQLPSTIQSLKLKDLSSLESFECADLSNIRYLWIENSPSVDAFDILRQIYNSDNNNLRNIRIVGFDETIGIVDEGIFANIADNLDKNGNEHTYLGIDSNGNSADISLSIEGTLRANNGMHEVAYDSINERFTAITLICPENLKYFKFEDPLVESIVVSNWSSNKIGITLDEIKKVSIIKDEFHNSSIEFFNEFELFTGITSLGSSGQAYYGFVGCNKLKKLRLPRTISITGNTSVSSRPFNGCTVLEEIYVPSSLKFHVGYICQSAHNLKKVDTDDVDNALRNWDESPSQYGNAVLCENGTPVTEITVYKNNVVGFTNSWVVHGLDQISTELRFTLCTFSSNVDLPKANIKITFYGCTFNENVYVYNIASSMFQKCTFNGDIVFNKEINQTSQLSFPVFYNCGEINIHLKHNITLNSNYNKQITDVWNAIICAQSVSSITCQPDEINKIIFEDKDDAISMYTGKTTLSSADFTAKYWYINDSGVIQQWLSPLDLKLKSNNIYNISYMHNKNMINSIDQNGYDILKVGSYCFRNMSKDFELDFSKVETVGSYAFENIGFIIPKLYNLKSVNALAFNKNLAGADLSNCSTLYETSFGSSTTKWITVDFSKYSVPTSLPNLKGTIVNLLNDGLFNCPAVVRSPSGVLLNGEPVTDIIVGSNHINSYAYYYFRDLTNIDLTRVETINNRAFTYSGIKQIVIPESVKTIGSGQFSNDGTSIVVLSETPPTLTGPINSSSEIIDVFVPDDAIDDYKGATNWSSLSIHKIADYFEWEPIPWQSGGYTHSGTNYAIGQTFDDTIVANSNKQCVILPISNGRIFTWISTRLGINYDYCFLDENNAILNFGTNKITVKGSITSPLDIPAGAVKIAITYNNGGSITGCYSDFKEFPNDN